MNTEADLLYWAFGRTRLWKRVAGPEVPDCAQDFGAACGVLPDAMTQRWIQTFVDALPSA
ncbi:MAG: hypothetical protein OEM85_17645 [Gammaproteobacteria bacterium]|nr:hypothetical protein [Gammaproteobacteria bacterium]MDH3375186.1 hypothetical protein [Gammaproteobacteria bacterium]MDH3410210.1 hypothetical protein [Gammaproteobacteria bacterium]